MRHNKVKQMLGSVVTVAEQMKITLHVSRELDENVDKVLQ